MWKKLAVDGEQPSARAAHAAASVGNMVVIVGGIGPSGLSSDDLHVLDMSVSPPKWHRVVVQGPGPGARYAHTLSLVADRHLVICGGNDGRKTLGDAWSLDTSSKPYQWTRIDVEPGHPVPAPRMYAEADARRAIERFETILLSFVPCTSTG